jgi:RNA polymerase sigma factor (sigma-70 family)
MMSDSELLARFARSRSEDAFAELVRRHVNLVYSAALRQVGGDGHLAQDVAQTVFSDLARKAPALVRRATLTGWLYTSARFAAAKILRSEHRRRHREEEYMRESNHAAPETDWEQLRPVLDEVMHQLQETDREAILLRYFENRPFAEIGARCGLNENAARMRVERALEKLRGLLATRGITTATTLASVISAHAVQVAPVGLAATIATTSLTCAGTGTLTFWNTMNMTKLKLGLGALVVAGASTALIVQHQAREKLLMANEALTQQIAQLMADNDSLATLAAQAKPPASPPSEQFDELLRLRGEVGLLRQQTNELGRLRQENRKLLSQVAAQSESTNQVSAEDQFTLRQTHAVDAMTTLLNAIKSYATNHNGQYPGSLEQLTASGDLGGSRFVGNLGLDDFEFTKDGVAAGPKGEKVILSLWVPLQRPGRPSVIVLGGIGDGGVTHTITMNVSADAAQASPAPPQ